MFTNIFPQLIQTDIESGSFLYHLLRFGLLVYVVRVLVGWVLTATTAQAFRNVAGYEVDGVDKGHPEGR